MQLKTCSKCGEQKPLSSFGARQANRDGKSGWCRDCYNSNSSAYYWGDIDSKRAYNSKWSREFRKNNPEKFLLKKAKERARERNLDFDISEEDIEIPEVCPVLGIALRAGKGKVTDNSPTLDRSDNSKGYVKGNVQVISWRANRLKSDMSLEEAERLYKWLKKTGQPQCS